MKSMATTTTIRSAVPPSWNVMLNATTMNSGSRHTRVTYSPPNRVSRVMTSSMCRAVCAPGRMPGT